MKKIETFLGKFYKTRQSMHRSMTICLEILNPPRIFSLNKPPIRRPSSFSSTVPSSLAHRKVRIHQVVTGRSPLLIRRMSDSTSSISVEKETFSEDGGAQQIQFLTGVNDNYDGVTVTLEDLMDVEDFAVKLKASLLNWKQEGKKGIWIKIPIGLANLVEAAVKEGFRYHHAEPDYLMLVTWISEHPDTIPANASHRVGVGAFVLNPNGEVLVVQETGGAFKGKNVWKLPTGVVNQGEDIWVAAVREVKEETGIDTDFVEVLAFRQSHKSFYGKSDLFFLCVLSARSFEIQKQDSEILAAQWMPVKEYVNQRFNQEHELFRYMANICLKKMESEYCGFSPVSTVTSNGHRSYMFCNSHHADILTKAREEDKSSI